MTARDDTDLDDVSEEPRPKPRTNLLNLILIGLNLVVGLVFVVLLTMDYSTRQNWSLMVQRHDLALFGLTLDEEAGRRASGARAAAPAQDIAPPALKREFESRKGRGKIGNDAFQSVQENFRSNLAPDNLSKETLEERFKGAGTSVKSIDEEVDRLANNLPGMLEEAVEAAPKNAQTEADKRALLRELLWPLARGTDQVEALQKALSEIKSADADALGKALDSAIKLASRRKLVADILVPLDALRPPLGAEDLRELAKRSVEVMKRFEVPLPNAEAFARELQKRLAEKGEKDKHPLTPLDLFTEVKNLMAQEKVSLPEDDPAAGLKSKRAAFELAIERLLYRPSDQLVELDALNPDQLVGLEPARFVLQKERLDELLRERIKETLDKLGPTGRETREPSEKRRSVAVLLFVLSQVMKPGHYELTAQAVDALVKEGAPEALVKGVEEFRKTNQDKVFATRQQFLDALQSSLGAALVAEHKGLLLHIGSTPLYPPERAEAVVGLLAFTQAADLYTTALGWIEKRQLAAIQRDRGDYLYASLEDRHYDGDAFAEALLKLLQSWQVPFADDNARMSFKEGVKKALEEWKADLVKSRAEGKEKKLPEQDLYNRLKALVRVPEDAPAFKVKEYVFEREVYRLLDPRAEGFLTRYEELIEQIRDVSAAIEERQQRLAELQKMAEGQQRLYADRKKHADEVAKEVVEIRKQTRSLADHLALLQTQLFLTQRELAGVDVANQRMEQRIRHLERVKGGQGR